jgi:hypothetical protein
VPLSQNAGVLQASPPRNESEQLVGSLPAYILCQRPLPSYRGQDHLVARQRRASAAEEMKASLIEVAMPPPYRKKIAEAGAPRAWMSSELRRFPRSPPILQEDAIDHPLSAPPWPEKEESSSSTHTRRPGEAAAYWRPDHHHGGLMEEHVDHRPSPRKNVSFGSHRREKEVGLFGEDPGTQLRLRHSPCHRRWTAKKNTTSFQIRPTGPGNILRALRHSTASSRQDLQLNPKLKPTSPPPGRPGVERSTLKRGLGGWGGVVMRAFERDGGKKVKLFPVLHGGLCLALCPLIDIYMY